MYTELSKWSNIQMKADKTVELNISGYIGVPEWWQFSPDMEDEFISTKEKMQAELKAISNLKADTIKVNIDSLGGNVNHGQAMYTALVKNPAKIEVVYTGWSASIATIIAAAATDGNISMSPTNMILIHEGRGCECGVASTMVSYANMLNKVNDTMSGVYASQTGKTKDEMREIMSRNNGEGEWLTAQEAQEIGLIKTIDEPLQAAASYDLSRLSKFGYKLPQNKLNNLSMKFNFGKKEEVVNSVKLQDDSTLIYTGELKEGTELRKLGESIELKGEHVTADSKKITVDDNNIVLSIEDIELSSTVESFDSEAFRTEIKNEVAEAIVEATKPILAALASIKVGTHTPQRSGSPENKANLNVDPQMMARKSVSEIVKEKTDITKARSSK